MSKVYQVNYPSTIEVWYCKNYYWFKKKYNQAQKERWSWKRPISWENITHKKWVKYHYTFKYHTLEDVNNDLDGETYISGRTYAEAWQTFRDYYLNNYDFVIIVSQSVKVEVVKDDDND